MKNYILTHGSIKETVVTRFAFNNADWSTLGHNQRYGCFLKVVSPLSLSTEDREKVSQTAQGNLDSVELPGHKLVITKKDRQVEVKLIHIAISYPTMVECNNEEYADFIEDAIGKETK